MMMMMMTMGILIIIKSELSIDPYWLYILEYMIMFLTPEMAAWQNHSSVFLRGQSEILIIETNVETNKKSTAVF